MSTHFLPGKICNTRHLWPILGTAPLLLSVDVIVLCLYFFGIVGIGLWAGRRNRTLTDFALGGRTIPWWAVSGVDYCRRD